MGLMLLQMVCVALVMQQHTIDAAVTVWAVPAIGATSTTVIEEVDGTTPDDTATIMVDENTAAGATVTTVTATADNTETYATTNTMFGVVLGSGVVFLHCSTLADSTTTEYTVDIVATDTTDSATGTLTLTIKVNRAPVITGGRICTCDIATATASGATLKAFTATDANTGDTRVYSAIAGNGAGDWAISGTDFNTGATLDNTETKCYDLSFTVTDNGGGAGAGTAAAGSKSLVTVEMSISVGATGTTSSCSCSDGSSGNSAAVGIVGSMMLLLAVGIAHIM